jgi:hypothetical protein
MGTTGNREKGGSKGTVPGWNWNDWDVVFLVLPLVLTIFVPSQAILYMYGRLNWHPALLNMFHLGAAVFIVCCFFVSMVRLFIGWGKQSCKRRLLMVAEVGIPIAFVVLLPFGKGFTCGFRDRIRSKADIPAIRTWLRTLDRSDYDEYGHKLHVEKWPESLRKLKLSAGAVTLRADQNGKPQVEIIEGGAILHWGVTIGMEDMEIPVSNIKKWFASWLLVEPGVYVYVYNW